MKDNFWVPLVGSTLGILLCWLVLYLLACAESWWWRRKWRRTRQASILGWEEKQWPMKRK